MANIILFKAPVSAPLLEEYLSDNLLMPGTARHSAEKTHHVLCIFLKSRRFEDIK